jgi:uncharacterized protein (TIGR02246 family)
VTEGTGTETRVAMVHTMCQQVDAGDAAGFARWFADDTSYVFANGPALEGRAAVEAATAQAAGAIRGLHHHVDQVAEVGDQLFCRFTIHGLGADDRPVALPCVTVIWLREDGAVVDYRVHMDPTPFSPG